MTRVPRVTVTPRRYDDIGTCDFPLSASRLRRKGTATEYVTQRDLDAVRTELRGEFAELRGEFAELRGEFRELRGEVRGEIGTLRTEIAAQSRSIIYANLATVIGVGGLVLAAARLT